MVHARVTGNAVVEEPGNVAAVPVPQTLMLVCGRWFSPLRWLPGIPVEWRGGVLPVWNFPVLTPGFRGWWFL